jgi:hypothetical protein
MEIPLPVRGFAFYRSLEDDSLVRLRAAKSVTTREVDVRTTLSKIALLQAVADALEAPDRYLTSTNYDSFDEAVRDLGWLEFDNLMLILVGCSRQWTDNYAAMSVVLEICVDAHLFCRTSGRDYSLHWLTS